MGRIRIVLKGIHRVRKRLAGGGTAEYHYAWRGGLRFWDNSMPFGIHSIEYVEAHKAATAIRIETAGTFSEVIEEFLGSREFAGLSERTRKDHRTNIVRNGGIEAEFGRAPTSAFGDSRIRTEILRWRDRHTAGTGDNMMATMQRIISFAHKRNILTEHHLLNLEKRAKSNRAGIIWTQGEIDVFIAGAPRFASRILVAAVETGFRPGDLQVLSRRHFEKTRSANGRIVVPTKKSNGQNFATVPVTNRMAALVAELPADQDRILLTGEGIPFGTTGNLGRTVSEWRDTLGIRRELKLYDARGTAVTRLVRAGCTLTEMAAHMGWGFQHASAMVEKYARLDPDMTDGILEKTDMFESRQK